MRALTVLQPWAHCIVSCGKEIENRTWAPPIHLIGQRIAIHAGKSIDYAGFDWLVERGVLRRTGLVGLPLGAIVATVRLDAPSRTSTSPWAEAGLVHWLFNALRPLSSPVECRGAQGLWTVPDDVERLVLERELKKEY